jgi:hypothetical protein
MSKIMFEKSNIIKLSNIDYVEILAFNIKHYTFEILFKINSLNLNKNEEFIKLFL